MMFDAYKRRDLQHFTQMLNQCEADGITDIRFIRQQLHKHLYRPQKVRPVNRKKLPKINNCPECGAVMSCGTVVDGLKINGCRKCRYSEVIA